MAYDPDVWHAYWRAHRDRHFERPALVWFYVSTAKLRAENPLGRFAGLDVYFDRGHLATAEVATAWNTSQSWGEFLAELRDLPFYRAMAFTLTYTFVCTPALIMLGFAIAVAVKLHRVGLQT